MPRHSPYALYSLNFITLFSINCFSLSIAWVSFDNFYLGLLLLSIREKVLPFALSLSFPPCSLHCLANCSYPRFLERPFLFLKTVFLNYLFVLLYLLYSVFNEHLLANHQVCWWAQMDSNHRPRAYQARALTTWAMSPYSVGSLSLCPLRHLCLWWRWWDSNPWPPACRAGALPTELHPH